MSEQTTHRFSVKDYYRMAETGVLALNDRVELLDGEIIDMSPIGPFHGSVVKHLNEFFGQCAQGRWLVVIQDPLRLDDRSEPEPDVMLVRRSSDYYASTHPLAKDVFLLIEVSDSTLELDRGPKLSAYSRAGISEVWIVNLIEAAIEVYREPHFTGYASKTILRAGNKAAPQSFPDASVDVGELLRR